MKSETLCVRLTPEAKALVAALAKQDGRSISNLVERMILMGAAVSPVTPHGREPDAYGVISAAGKCLASACDVDNARNKAGWSDPGWQASGPFTVEPLYRAGEGA